MGRDEYNGTVFINCPFDREYKPLFEAIVFAVNDAGFQAKCARDRLDSSQVRLRKIFDLISGARYSIHDLSRTTLDDTNALPRFNMPLELGIDLGCKEFKADCSDKSLLIFDSEQYRFQKFISDLGGQDILQHNNTPQIAVARVRDWLRTESGKNDIPGGGVIYGRYEVFRRDLPKICSELKLDLAELTFLDFSYTVGMWLEENA